MTPRKTQLGASASARKAPVRRGAGAAPSVRPPTKAKPSRPRGVGSNRPKRDASWFRWWLLPIFVAAAVTLFVITYYPLACVQYKETRQRAQLQAELTALQTRNVRLGTQVARLKTNEGVEDYARSQLGMVKQGEHVVVVTDGTKASTQPTATIAGPPQIETSGETIVAPSGPWTAFLDAVFTAK